MSGHLPTGPQARASDPSHSVWVTANAGTGKTRVLSDRVLRLLLDGAYPEAILCITFTRAAAVEMTARIEKALADWAVETDDDRLRASLEAITGAVPGEGELATARRLFARVLDLPAGLPIQTIHGFCAGLLRRFPIEAGIPPHFESIDDRTAGEMMRESRSRLLGVLREGDAELRDALDRLAAILAETSLGDLLAEILRNRRAIEKALEGGLDSLLDRLHRLLGVVRGIDPKEMVARACGDGAMDVHRLKQAADALCTGSDTDTDRGRKIMAWLGMTPSNRVDTFELHKRCFLTAAGTPVKRLATQAVQKNHPGAFEALLQEQVRIVQLGDDLKAAQIAIRSAAMLTVAQALLNDYREAKEREGALDFDDLIHEAARLLSDEGRRDWVLYKLDARIEHILVDEAQDTSPAQWTVIEHLLEEIASGKGQHDRPRTLFVVGDEKQSIYSFQGADLENFHAVRRRVGERMELRDERLEVSFRSCSTILSLVDGLLENETFRAGVLGGGELRPHTSSRPNDEGRITLWPLAEAPDAGEEREPWALPDARNWRPGAEEVLARRLAREIGRRLADPAPLASTGRRLCPSDILILVSRRGRIQELVISALKKRGIPVAGADRLGLTDHIAVRDLMALGQALLLPEDDLNFACLLKSPLVGLDENALFELAFDRDKRSLHENLRLRRDHYPEAFERIESWLARADFMPPFELFTLILAEGGRNRLLGRLGPDAAEPIEAFLGQALAFEQGHPATLQGFMHWLTMDRSSLKRDPEPARDEIRVMTVHGSKGLEAPFVILADAGPRQSAERGKIIVDPVSGVPFWRGASKDREPYTDAIVANAAARRDEEASRLLYVALTRARDELLIAGWAGARRTNVEDCWHGMIDRTMAGLGALRDRESGNAVLRHGTAPPARIEEAPDTARSLPLPQWAREPVVAEPPATRPLAPTRLAEDETPASSPASTARDGRTFGLHMHMLLHQLAGVSTERRETLLSTLPPEIAAEVRSVLDLPGLEAVFAPGSLAEQPIIGRIGDIVVSGQIDRLAVLPDRVVMVDFKTNRRPPASLDKVPVAYLRQLGAYAALLGAIFPGRRIVAALVWTAVPAIMEIPAGLLERHAPNATGRNAPA
ncbi:MAG: double-strand break repair helicase AddA [Geminicoccaceae bacterium]